MSEVPSIGMAAASYNDSNVRLNHTVVWPTSN